MQLYQAILMGIVQGLSEFLPISSSAHLVFTSNFYKMLSNIDIIHSNQEIFLDIILHLGTLIAVFIYFRKEIFSIIKAFYLGIKTKDYHSEDFKTGVYIILGTLITFSIAYPLNNIASKLVFKPHLVAILLIITSFILFISEYIAKKYTNKKPVKMQNSILMAIAQGIAALPGFSRSGLTIATGLLSGMDRSTAAKYSFLLSIPIITGASIFYPILAFDFKELITYNWTAIIIGFLVSGTVGYLCIKFFMKFLSKFSLTFFGYYCLFMGIFAFLIFS